MERALRHFMMRRICMTHPIFLPNILSSCFIKLQPVTLNSAMQFECRKMFECITIEVLPCLKGFTRCTSPSKNHESRVQFEWKCAKRVAVVYRWLMTYRLVWAGENWPLLIFGTPPLVCVLTLGYTRFCLSSPDRNFRVTTLLWSIEMVLNYSLCIFIAITPTCH